MAYTDLDKPSLYFNAKAYTGDGTTSNTITGIGFQSDMVWFKSRSTTDSHFLTDSVRGITKYIRPQGTNAEETETTAITSLTSDGYVLSTAGNVNDNNVTYVSWNWKEQPGVFDIVGFTGNGNARTISHNLGSVPKFMIIKDRDNVTNWGTYHVAIGATKNAGYLNNTVVPEANANFWNNTTPTASVFSVGTDGTYNGNGNDYIIYLFGNKQGVSHCGSYTGNGNADGTFVYTGFKPAFMIVKRAVGGTGSWGITDGTRDPFNPVDNYLSANNGNAESDFDHADFLSNGIKFRTNNDGWNQSGNTYIYMAFAENPFVTSTGIPTTAR